MDENGDSQEAPGYIGVVLAVLSLAVYAGLCYGIVLLVQAIGRAIH